VLAEAAVVIAAAALSFRFVEEPIRSGRLQRWLGQYSRRFRLEVVGAAAVVIAAAFAILFVTPASLNPVSTYVSPTKATAATHHPPHTATISKPITPAKLAPLPPGRILALGDSVMLGCKTELKTALQHRVRVDATVGRQIHDTVKELERLRRHDKLAKTLVLQIGNNGPLWFGDLKGLRHALRGIPDIVVVNVRNSTSWQDESNQALVNWLHDWRVAHLADWYGHSTNKMLSDGTHPWPYACRIYARVIANTLRSSST
jgi:hypothetical protein